MNYNSLKRYYRIILNEFINYRKIRKKLFFSNLLFFMCQLNVKNRKNIEKTNGVVIALCEEKFDDFLKFTVV